ncbi:hypothetical protein AQUCO_04100122v1 [Aquilegia coerulea]|uniref:Uncharacterized protein n=1 Tax=Aquilegia coerulea TaxID=218851 RepID=A0A2G5CQE5_AQUCA|nr:hypothetical protein AQUCO_04100122v1 [Aquilegia coerulea]
MLKINISRKNLYKDTIMSWGSCVGRSKQVQHIEIYLQNFRQPFYLIANKQKIAMLPDYQLPLSERELGENAYLRSSSLNSGSG